MTDKKYISKGNIKFDGIYIKRLKDLQLNEKIHRKEGLII